LKKALEGEDRSEKAAASGLGGTRCDAGPPRSSCQLSTIEMELKVAERKDKGREARARA
jgi:hypothetical protein